jgi:hypothetical protein
MIFLADFYLQRIMGSIGSLASHRDVDTDEPLAPDYPIG